MQGLTHWKTLPSEVVLEQVAVQLLSPTKTEVLGQLNPRFPLDLTQTQPVLQLSVLLIVLANAHAQAVLVMFAEPLAGKVLDPGHDPVLEVLMVIRGCGGC